MDNARKPLRIGILGAARIAPSAIIFPAHATGHQLVAVGARDKGRANEFAKQYMIEKAYGVYGRFSLLLSPSISKITGNY